jgi:transcriptional regulator with PAS, ATPase and Fis domain
MGHGGRREGGEPVPGVVVVFSAGAPCARVIALAGGAVELGRGDGGPDKLDDGRVSRRHARVAFEAGRCVVTDLGSQNGSFVDGERAAAHAAMHVYRVIRIGDSLLVPLADVRPYERADVRFIDGFVRGPAMQAVLDEAARAAHAGTTLHVRGETGTGKEGVVQAFHRASPRAAAPLIAVNCAAIPSAIAERLLFGTRRGTYTGAQADASGYVEDADGGTLFLDEVAELDLQVQAKLLRVLESREVLALGASKPRKVDFAMCSATHKDLRALVAAGSFREDLYFRIGRPGVTVPVLRNRPEEIAALIAHDLGQLSPPRTAHVSLVEQCLMRAWPGNVRELLAEVRIAADAALPTGTRVEARHLAPSAGAAFGRALPEPPAPPGPAAPATPPSQPPGKRISRDAAEWQHRITEALRDHGGNVAASARALGIHRTQLRRLIERHGIQVADTGDGDDDDDGDDRDE